MLRRLYFLDKIFPEKERLNVMTIAIECFLVCIVAVSIGYPFLLKEYNLGYRKHIENELEQEIQATRNCLYNTKLPVRVHEAEASWYNNKE